MAASLKKAPVRKASPRPISKKAATQAKNNENGMPAAAMYSAVPAMPMNLKPAAIRKPQAKISRASSNAAVLAISVILSGPESLDTGASNDRNRNRQPYGRF